MSWGRSIFCRWREWLGIVISVLGREFRHLAVLRWEVRRQRGRQRGKRLGWHFDGIFGFYGGVISARVSWGRRFLGRWRRWEFRHLAVFRWEVRRQRGRQRGRRLGWHFDRIFGFYGTIISARVSWGWSFLGRWRRWEFRHLAVLRWEVRRQRGRQRGRRLSWHFDGIFGVYGTVISARVSWGRSFLGRWRRWEFRRLAVLWWVRRQRGRQRGKRVSW